MVSSELMRVLADLPDPGGFIAPWKAVLLLVCFGIWAAFGQWVNKDTQDVRMNRNLWNGIILTTGAIGILAWLWMPLPGTAMYFVGFGVWLLVVGGSAATYVIMRNGLVPERRRVFTQTHIKSKLMANPQKSKKDDSLERVKLTDSNGRSVKAPVNEEDHEGYQAVQDLLLDALWRRATEVDMALTAEAVRIGYRIDGVPMERKELLDHPRSVHAFRFLKSIAGLDAEDRRRPQKGTIVAEVPGSGEAKIKVKSSGSTVGERLQLGVLSEQSQMRLTELGFAPPRLEKFLEAVRAPKGLVLCSGIRQSGLTTTLYAAMRDHDAFMQNLHAFERKALYELENITQHAYDSQSSDVSYARKLQSVLRREPDVVLVADCVDEDTAKLSTKAAANGRKIYLEVAGKDCFDALHKLMNFCGDTSDLAASLLVVTSQRLIRKLCTSCREAYTPDAKLLKKINLPADKIEFFYRPPTEPLVDKKGRPITCPECQGTGYVGRTGVFEIVMVDDELRRLIKAKADIPALKSAARKNKALYLQEEGLLKVMEGLTSMNEMIRALKDNGAG